jgi:hypothetical protein
MLREDDQRLRSLDRHASSVTGSSMRYYESAPKHFIPANTERITRPQEILYFRYSEVGVKNSNPVSRKRQSGSIRNTVIVVVVLLIVIAWLPGYYNVYQEDQHIQLIAKNMLSLPDSARTAINDKVTRSGSLTGSGKGVSVPPNKMTFPLQELEWKVSDDGNILGRNTGGSVIFGVVVEWTPTVQDKRVIWNCKVTYPGRFVKLALPPCPEIS